MYRRIGELSIDPNKASGCDGIVVDCSDSQEPIYLRVSFFKDGHYQDEAIASFTIEENCVMTDADAWKRRCLDLAAQLDVKEREGK